MADREALLKRLNDIGVSVAQSGKGLAVLGLGSVGHETDRIDQYSDLDFFVIVQPGTKQDFIHNLDWMQRVHPIAFSFLNTADGSKLLFADGIFCEYAVFEPDDLETIPFSPGRIVWKAEGVPNSISQPRMAKGHASVRPAAWNLGEALTNLYVGLGRYHRGEKLSAMRFIQNYAVDRVLELAETLEAEKDGHKDSFSRERRIETRMPELAAELPAFMQGYDRSPESAQAILAYLERHFDVNPMLRAEILRLCERL